MKKQLFIGLLALTTLGLWAQSIKGPDHISYFQAPTEGVKFASADVYLLHDSELQKAQLEEAKNNPMGFGGSISIGGSAGELLDRITSLLSGEIDNDGLFDTWGFVPPYIIAEAETNKNVIVEIFFLNGIDPGPSTANMSAPQADKNGFYNVPYYINCRFTVSTPKGEIVLNKDLGVLKGTRKSKNPPPAPPQGGMVSYSDEEFDESEKIGINVAVNQVRKEVFALYGFGQFDAPIKLGVIKEIKESKKLIPVMLDIFENKEGLLLNTEEKAEVQKFVDIIENGISKTSDKTRWVAYHNLSVCYAWLEDAEKAKEAYVKYGEEISVTLDKFRRWNLAVQGKLPKDQRKGLFIGGKDTKKYNNYRNIETFVNYYATGAKKYEKLFFVINRDLNKFVDFYAHNDLLCQLYEIDFPYQFFPLNDFEGSPKSMKGSLTKKDMEPIEINMKFDSDRRIKELETSQITKLEGGGKEKLISRELQPIFNDKSGRYIMISDPDKRGVLAGNSVKKSDLKRISEPLSDATMCRVDNITTKTGFFSDKESNEKVQLKVDLEGNIFYVGSSSYFKANAIFKDILASNGIEVKKTYTNTEFTTAANINKQGVMNKWSWDGNVSTSFASVFSSREQSITATKMLREIEFVDADEHGNPTQIKFNFVMKGSLDVEQKMSVSEWFARSYEQGTTPNGEMTSEGFDIQYDGIWECNFIYDEKGNWTEMKIGPYTAQRTFKY
ncbi:MAG: hypothetical protein B7C24_16270 [Bacteroidetes bacterium 4572_77]|nr:MAG: hypothetical protein B7C24_16270 [Bacteroidetes bacterium 4572_77]